MSSLKRIALLSLALVTGATAAAQSVQSPRSPETPSSTPFALEHSQLAATAVSRFERLAAWCHERRLYRQRDATYRSILKFDPDHAEARKFLKFRRTKDGQWIDTGGYREPRERKSTDLPEYERMHADLIADLGQQVFELLERHGSSMAGSERQALLETLLDLDPDHVSAHAELGEVHDPASNAWILVESASSRKRHAALAGLATRLVRAGPKVAAAEADAPERELGLEWRSVLRTERVKILSTVPGSPPAECVRLAESVMVLFDAALRPDARTTSGFEVYLLASASEKAHLLEEHPAVGPARASEFRHYDSFWIPGRSELVVCAEVLKDQLEQIVIQTTARKLCDHFGVGTREGIVHAGVTSYLSALIDAARSSGTASVASHTGSEALDRPDVELMLRKPYQELSREEQVAGRVLFEYLIEGWPESTPFVLGRVGTGVPLHQALHDLLGFDMETLLERLARRDREILAAE
jgi:hypothetical protein